MFWVADSSGGIAGLFTALGLNWRGLILNTLAFLVIAWLLGKFVYPSLIQALDAKKDELEAATNLQQEAQGRLEKAEQTAAEIVAGARTSAEDIIAASHDEATKLTETAKSRAGAQAERIVSEAREQLSQDVSRARAALKSDTAKLVAAATGTILDERLDVNRDAELIRRSLDEKH